MSRLNRGEANRSKSSLGRRRRTKRDHALLEALEIRRLLTVSYQPYTFTNVGIGGTGTDYNCTLNPHNPQDMYVETDMGEVWHTTNDGLNWITLNFQVAPNSEANENSVQFTNNTNIQYAIDKTATEPMVTYDDGATWEDLPGYSAIASDGGNAIQINADPNNSQRIIVTQYKSSGGKFNNWIWYSSNGGTSLTTGAGTGWQLIYSDTSGTNPNEVWTAGSFWDTGTNVGATNMAYFATDLGLFTTPNVTAATPTWTNQGEPLANSGYYNFAGSEVGGATTLWAVTWGSSTFDGTPVAMGGGSDDFTGIWSSTNSGTGWNSMNADGPTVTSGTSQVQVPWGQTSGAQLYPINVQMLVGNINDVWVGGRDFEPSQTGGDTGTPIVFESTSAGTSGSWINLLLTGSDTTYFNSDGQSVTSVTITNSGSGYSHSAPPTVLFSAPTGVGIHVTATGNAVVNTSGVVTSITITNAGSGYSSDPTITIAPPTSGTTAAATAQDLQAANQNVFTRTVGITGGGSREGWGSGFTTLTLDPLNPAIIVFTNQGSIFETANAGSTKDGTLWYDIEAGGPLTPTQGSFTQPTDDGVQADEDPNYEWSTTGAYSSGGTAWQQNAEQFGDFYSTSSMEETSVWDMSFSSANDIFTDNTDVAYEVTTNAGATWAFPTNAGTANESADNVYQSILDPNNSNTIYAVTSAAHNLYTSDFTGNSSVENSANNLLIMSTDGGVVWTQLYAFPSDAPARTLAIDPNNDNIMFVGTANHLYGGIWETTNLQQGTNATWTHLGDGSGLDVTAVIGNVGTNTGVITGFDIISGGSGYTPGTSGAVLYIDGEHNHGGASATPVVNSNGVITGFINLVGGSGYPSATGDIPSTAHGSLFVTNWNTAAAAPADQPSRLLNSTGTASGSIQTFSAVHPIQLDVLNSSSGSTINVVAVMAEEQNTTSTLEEAGIWTGTSTDSGATWTWTDMSGDNGTTSQFVGPGTNILPTYAWSLTIDPNVAGQTTWFATVADGTTSNAGDIYETTNSGATWSVYSTVGEGYSFWIQKGGTAAMFGIKYGDLMYTPDYTAANPLFYDEANFPFWLVNNILTNTSNTNQIFICTFGDGMWETNISDIGLAAPPANVTAQSVSPTQALVSWTEQAPTPDNGYKILASTSSTNWSSAITTSVNFAPEPLGLGSITILPSGGGTGFSGNPFVTITGGGGSGATAVASESGGSIFSIVVTNPGTGYTSAPTISFSGAGSGVNVTPNLIPVPSTETVTGLSPGTVYYFEMEAINSAGTSGASNVAMMRTDSAAKSIAYDGFNDTAGPLNGQAGGSGWASGGWSAGTNATVVTGTLTLADGATAPNSAPGYASITHTAGAASRTLNSTVGVTGTVLWAGLEQESYYYNTLNFGNSTTGFGFGLPTNTSVITFYTVTSGTMTPYLTLDNEPTSDEYFYVVRMDFEAAGTYVNLYLDPTPGTIPTPGAEATWASGGTTLFIPISTWAYSQTSTVMLTAPESGTANYDEIRLGNTYGDVAPSGEPNAPNNFTAMANPNNSASVVLSWSESSTGSIDYNIERSGGGSGYSPLVSGLTTSSYTDSSTLPNTTYYYEVDAYYTSTNPSSWTTAQALTIPAAPTGLAATPGTNAIVLTWASNTNESSYTIQRSTTDLAGSWSNMVTSYSNTASSWTDSTPASGTTYYYQIEAVNATGSSAYDGIGGIASGVATVYAYEGFNYPTNSAWNGSATGGNLGIGFTGNWTIANSSHASIVSGLTYNSGSSYLTASGNALEIENSDTATQTLCQSVGTSSSATLWVGFELNTSGGSANRVLQIGSGTVTGNVEFGWLSSGTLSEEITTSTDAVYTPTGYTGALNTPYFIVGEIQYSSSAPVITMYVNPTPNSANGATPSGELATITKTVSSGTLGSTTALSIFNNANNFPATFDEVRLGATYNSVAPDPIVSGESGNSGNSSKHHSRTPRGHRPNPFLVAPSAHAAAANPVWTDAADVISSPWHSAAGFFADDTDTLQRNGSVI